MPLTSFHPAVASWFARALGEPTAPQRAAWPAIQAGKHVLVAAPTGSGKTLAAFLSAIDALLREGLEMGELPDETRVLYVSPLKALSHDVQKNLELPLRGVSDTLLAQGRPAPSIRSWVRTGDTDARARAQAVKRPPHIVVTTPESLYLLLTSEGGRRMLASVRTVIVDEVHALVRDKRGSHLALSLERLEALVEARAPAREQDVEARAPTREQDAEAPGSAPRARLQRIGLSATQKPIAEVARFLVGARGDACEIIDAGHRRDLDLSLLLPRSPLEAVMSNEVWDELYEQLVALIDQHTTTLVFVNTRRSAERVARRLSERLGEAQVGSHHGSLSREKRLEAEQRLKAGALKALVATASLELGIDIGDVDLVCQLGSPRSIAGFLQRVGRSGHRLSAQPKGRLLPLSRDDLVECTALLAAVARGELDSLRMPEAPLDVLAQQIVAASGLEAWDEAELFALVRRAWPYRALPRADFDAVVRTLAEGFSTRRGRRAALLHHDAVGRRLKARRGALLTAVTSGGAIPDSFDYQVLLEPDNLPVGTVHEDFAIESMAGDVFQLGNVSYRIRKSEPGLLRVEDARGQTPSMPFWIADAPGRSDELSAAVSALRARVQELLAGGREHTMRALERELALPEQAARELVEYLGSAHAALGVLPTQDTLVVERFFDETDSMHVVLHTPYGTRINRAFGLALRKRFCRSFNVELQAAATDDGIVLSLGPMHSFALDEIFRFLRADGVRDVLIQALLPAPMFGVRFRWNASRALAVPRFRGGKKVPPRLQRMVADDLLAVAFPDQVACAENLVGEREIPDHPLVRQTIHDCLHEAMDIDGLVALLAAIESGAVRCVARELSQASPLSHELLGARPYAFLDDAPLEERRTQAVQTRRMLDDKGARELSALDPTAIARVLSECRPEPRDADELHDLLLVHAALPVAEGAAFQALFAALCGAGRAGCLTLSGAARADQPAAELCPRAPTQLWIPAERVALWRLIAPHARLEPATCVQPAQLACGVVTREDALREVLRGRLEAVGPTTASELCAALGLAPDDVELGLCALEAEGFVLRGHYRPGAHALEWCERRLLSRIHRATLERLRSEIEPVSPAVLMRFLVRHQHVARDTQLAGVEGLYAALAQLNGFELSACAWEGDVLPLRVSGFAPELLDLLCFAGRVSWARAARSHATRSDGPIRTTPIALYLRESMAALRGSGRLDLPLSTAAASVRAQLESRGASFVSELARATGLEAAHVQEALGELIGQGLVSSDGFAGLRALVEVGRARAQADAAGRYALLADGGGTSEEQRQEHLARSLLARWGILIRKLLERESPGLRWGELLRVLRRMEARGELRGGRFVANFGGEQYALPEVVAQLRRLRREPAAGELTVISASDPLNLVGILTAGPRIAAQPATRILLRDGLPVAALSAGKCQWLLDVAADERALLEAALRGRVVREPAPALSWRAQA